MPTLGTVSHDAPLVLVVDDDEGTRIIARAALENDGFRVAEASDGADALEFVRTTPPAIVLLDVVLPTMDGPEVCRELRNAAQARDMPVIMITGADDAVSVDRCYAAGATDFVSKPVPWSVLLRRIRFVIRARATVADLTENRRQLAEAQRVGRIGSWSLYEKTLRLSGEAQRLLGVDPAPSSA